MPTESLHRPTFLQSKGFCQLAATPPVPMTARRADSPWRVPPLFRIDSTTDLRQRLDAAMANAWNLADEC